MTASVSTTERCYNYKPVKGVPRPAWTYRAARRNVAFRPDDGVGVIWNGAATTYYRKNGAVNSIAAAYKMGLIAWHR